MDIFVKDYIGYRCLTKEDGQKIYTEISERIINGERCILNFEGVRQFAGPFFNFALGQFMTNCDYDGIRDLIVIKNINEIGEIHIDYIKKHIKRCALDPPRRCATEKACKHKIEWDS
jgi:hypothetical protein